jgi:hypothetical protein
MYGDRFKREDMYTFIEGLKKDGLSKSKDPKKALQEASGGRITVKKAHGRDYWHVVDAEYHHATEADLPLICRVIKAGGKKDDFLYLRSEDSYQGLRVHYKVSAKGKATMIDYRPTDVSGVVDAIMGLPVTSLVPLMGIHECLDEYINRRLADPDPAPAKETP